MKKYTTQLSYIVLPYIILTSFLLYFYESNIFYIISFMFLFGIIGNGITGHRLIAHRQFMPSRSVRKILYLLCTLAAFAPVWYWRAQHWHHHKNSDTDHDIHSPTTKTFWMSFFGWALINENIKKILKTEKNSIRESLNDPLMLFYSKHNYKIIWSFILICFLISPSLLLSYFIFYWLEIIRLGLITSLAHLKIPLSYRNFDTDDKSYNNLILGFITFGFGWHNNHHAYPMLLDTQIKWWEFDLEGKIAKFINKIPGEK
jgi:stearoyl-CoA desaturase (Delta-9 desaturase)